VLLPDSAWKAQQKKGQTDETIRSIDITERRSDPYAFGADRIGSVRRKQ
jgi:hypothetical protein